MNFDPNPTPPQQPELIPPLGGMPSGYPPFPPPPPPPQMPGRPAIGYAAQLRRRGPGGSLGAINNNSIFLFKVFGISVSLHWSWFLIAFYEISSRRTEYHAITYLIFEYLTLFAIVLLHEFGHALACRSVGGKADTIMLWPLGGVAFVSPPPRPGPWLWSIVGGPLVNVLLLPVFYFAARTQADLPMDAVHYLDSVKYINIALLVFNILPIYPLDGGKILQSLLWFIVGRGRSQLIASAIGILGAVAFGAYGLYTQSYFLVAVAVFMGMLAKGGFDAARMLLAQSRMATYDQLSCPNCHTHPPVGPYWSCPNCLTRFDAVATGAACPGCGTSFGVIGCLKCGAVAPAQAWTAISAVAAP